MRECGAAADAALAAPRYRAALVPRPAKCDATVTWADILVAALVTRTARAWNRQGRGGAGREDSGGGDADFWFRHWRSQRRAQRRAHDAAVIHVSAAALVTCFRPASRYKPVTPLTRR